MNPLSIVCFVVRISSNHTSTSLCNQVKFCANYNLSILCMKPIILNFSLQGFGIQGPFKANWIIYEFNIDYTQNFISPITLLGKCNM